MFAKKLTFLMDLTNTKNITLARALNLDASYISLLKNGKRQVTFKTSFLPNLSEYFVKYINNDFRKKALSIALENVDIDEKDLANLILNWLISKKDFPSEAYEIIKTFAKPQNGIDDISITNFTPIKDTKNYYFGIEGKQEALIRFLTEINNLKTPQTLLLFSDENMSQMYNNPLYTQKWSALLTSVLLKGNKIKIIYNVNQGMNELFQMLIKEIPVYASGLIEPYYYPKLKDGIFQHTFFIAPETKLAIVSSSIKQKVDNMVHYYVTDEKAIDALIEEYNNYFKLCTPLIKAKNTKEKNK